MPNLERAWRDARATWPDVAVSLAAFAAHVGDLQGDEHERAWSDLYLACACAGGDPAALARFEERYFPEVDFALRSAAAGAPTGDELRQALRERLFVGTADRPPRIAGYRGQGSLKSWVRATVTRLLLNLTMRRPPERPFDPDVLVSLLGAGSEPDLVHMRTVYRDELREAFAAAAAALTPKERNLLRYAFCDGLTVDEIGAAYGVHRATAARWVQRAGRALATAIREAVRQRLGLTDDEYASLVRMVRSQISVSLERLAAPEPLGA